MTLPSWLSTIQIGELLIVGTLIGGFLTVTRKTLPTLRRLGHLMDDILGEPARPGAPGRPGVLDRLATTELVLASLTREVQELHDEVRKLTRKDE